MYLVTIHVPIFLRGRETLLASDWKRSLELLRDSVAPAFGPLAVIAPSLPAEVNVSSQQLATVTEAQDGIKLVPSFELRCSCKRFWLQQRRRWIADLNRVVPQATVVHSGLEDLYRPISYAGLQVAWRHRVATVFVQDTDIALQHRQLASGGSWKQRLESRIYSGLYERVGRGAVRRCDLALLKGSRLMKKYGAMAKNPREFHDTSYSERDIVPWTAVEQRLDSLASGRAVRLVYCGRFEPRKGVDHSIEIVAAARARGAQVSLDLIGGGPEQARLEQMVVDRGLGEAVRFLGVAPYGPSLIARLAEYDGLLFTPLAEDTPRMIFDGYAAGLPLVAYDIDYVRERSDAERATVLLPSQDIDASATRLVELCARRESWRALARAAHDAANYHAAENWYRRRAEWTVEAYQRRKAQAANRAAT